MTMRVYFNARARRFHHIRDIESETAPRKANIHQDTGYEVKLPLTHCVTAASQHSNDALATVSLAMMINKYVPR